MARSLSVPFALLFAWPVMASPVTDSLQAVVDGHSSIPDRARALCLLAERCIPTDPATALGHAGGALRFAEQTGSQRLEHEALRVKARAERTLGLYAEFLQTAFKALELAQSMGDARAIAADLQDVSRAYAMAGLHTEAVNEARRALAMLLPLRDAPAIADAQLMLMRTLIEAGRLDEALRTGDALLNEPLTAGLDLARARIMTVMAEVYIAKGRHVDAIPSLTRAAGALAREGTPADRFGHGAARVRVAIALGRLAEAQAALAELLALGPQPAPAAQATLLDLQHRLAVANRRWEEAHRYLAALKTLEDSISSTSVRMKVASLLRTHELERSESANLQLRDRADHQEATIAEQRQDNRLLLALTLLLACMAGGFFLMARQALRTKARLKHQRDIVQAQAEEIRAKNLELQRQNMRLAESLTSEEEKEWMLSGIHHRVKNDLQVVESLLGIHAHAHQDPAIARSLREVQGRIRAMAQVHEHCYRSGNSGGDLQAHFTRLAHHVLVAHDKHDSVSVKVECTVRKLTPDTLLPLSLIVNELLTNALKHAFHGRDAGRINLLLRDAGMSYELILSDDGHGVWTAPGADRDGFGMDLVSILARQLDGELRTVIGHGTSFHLTFPAVEHALRKAS